MEIISPYPVDIKIEDVREAIKGCPEFFEKEEDDTIIFNYRFCSKRTFPSPEDAPDPRTKLLWMIKRECRGLVFSKETNKVISRRYHKFFNVGELPETEPVRIQLKERVYYILTKYDGVLVTPVRTNGVIRFSSKSGFGDVSKIIEERFLSVPENKKYFEFSDDWIKQDCTPIFEWCSPRSKIVLFYEKDLMILTSIRNNTTGLYIPHSVVEESSKKYGIPLTEANQMHFEELTELQAKMESAENIEGYVLRFDDDGSMFKLKTQWYFERSKKEKQEFSFNSERSIWRLILDQEVDDALALTHDEHLTRKVREFEVLLYDSITNTAKKYEDIANKYQDLKKSEYVDTIRKVMTNATGDVLAFLFKLYKPSKDPVDILLEDVKKSCSSVKTLERMKVFLGGISFSEQ